MKHKIGSVWKKLSQLEKPTVLDFKKAVWDYTITKSRVKRYWQVMKKKEIINSSFSSEEIFKEKNEDKRIKIMDFSSDFEVSFGDKEQIHIEIPSDLRNLVETTGTSLSAILVEALLNYFNSLKSTTEYYLLDSYSEIDLDFIWKLIKRNLTKANKYKNKIRFRIYEGLLDKNELNQKEMKKVEELRQDAFKLSKLLKGEKKDL